MNSTTNNNLQNIIAKYESNPFMYVEYPHKKYWNNKIKDKDELVNHFKNALLKNRKKNYLLYIHIPHCHTQCLYCTCHVEITKDYSRVKKVPRLFV